MEYEYELTFSTKSKKAALAFASSFEDYYSEELEDDWEYMVEELKEYSENAGTIFFYLPFKYCDADTYCFAMRTLFVEIAEKVKGEEFRANFVVLNYSCDWGNVHQTFEYSNGKLVENYVNTCDQSLYCDCDECGESVNKKIAKSTDHVKGKTYTCDKCGKELTFEESSDSFVGKVYDI